MSHETVVHSAKEFVRGEVHSNTADGIGSMLVELSRQARLRQQVGPETPHHHDHSFARYAFQAVVSGRLAEQSADAPTSGIGHPADPQ